MLYFFVLVSLGLLFCFFLKYVIWGTTKLGLLGIIFRFFLGFLGKSKFWSALSESIRTGTLPFAYSIECVDWTRFTPFCTPLLLFVFGLGLLPLVSRSNTQIVLSIFVSFGPWVSPIGCQVALSLWSPSRSLRKSNTPTPEINQKTTTKNKNDSNNRHLAFQNLVDP